MYEVWDTHTGNRLGEYPTLEAATQVLADVYRVNGAKMCSELIVLHDNCTDLHSDLQVALDGYDYAAQQPGGLTAHGNHTQA